MRTNKLFVCKYCDKILSCMKSVRCHITMKHRVDPENPIMYHDILVSPTEVDVLLGKKTNKSSSITADKDSRGVKVSNSVLHPKLYEVTAPLASNDHDQGLAFVITGHEVAAPSMVEQQAAPRIDQGSKEFKMRQEMTKPIEVTENMDTQGGTDPSVEQDLIEPMVRQDNVTEATVRQEITVPRDGQKNEVSMVRLDVTADKISKMSGTKEKKNTKTRVKKEKNFPPMIIENWPINFVFLTNSLHHLGKLISFMTVRERSPLVKNFLGDVNLKFLSKRNHQGGNVQTGPPV